MLHIKNFITKIQVWLNEQLYHSILHHRQEGKVLQRYVEVILFPSLSSHSPWFLVQVLCSPVLNGAMTDSWVGV